MLIECSHCGAPLDVKANERMTKCKYCDTTTQIKSSKTVAIQTPPDWKPPQQWTTPTQFAAQGKTFAYHATTAVSRIVKLAIILAILGAVLPVVLSIVFATVEAKRHEPDVQQVLSAAQGAINEATRQIETARHVAAAEENLLETGAVTNLVARYREALGGQPIRARELTIHPTHAELTAQDPKKPKNLDSYGYRAGTVEAPEAYRLTREKDDLEKYLFTLEEVSGLTRLSELMQQTVTTLGYEGGKVSHVIVERNIPFGKDVVIRVYVTSERDSGRIDFNGDGKVNRVFK